MSEALMNIKNQYTEEEKNKIMWFNWNRVSLLTNLPNRTEEQQNEISRRIEFHNDFRTVEEGTELELKILYVVEKSLTTKIKKEVNEYMKQNNKRRRGKHVL